PLIIPSYNKTKIIFVIMLGLYLHALPVILYNNPRHADVYSHEASTIAFLNHRAFPTENEYYGREYPGVFLFNAIQLLVTGMPDFVLLKFASVFLIILPGIIIYLMVKEVYPTMASIAALAFFATFINDQAHFSPQLFALSLYLTFLFGIQRISFYDKRVEKAWIIVTILAIVIVNISNPTQSYYLFGNLLAGFILMRLLRKPFHWNNKIIEDKIWTLLILTTVILISWSAYIGLGKAVYEPSDLAKEFVTSLTSPSLNRLPIHPDPPDESVFIATYIGYVIRIGTVLMGIMTFVILYLRRKFLIDRSTIPYLIVTAALFVVCMSFIPIALLQSTTHTFLLRALMYAGISWSISIPFFINLPFRSTVARRLKYLPVVFAIVSIILMPLGKYGADYFSFVPSSQLYMADFIDQHSGKVYGMLPITDNTWNIFFYYHTLNHNSSLPVLRPYPDEYRRALAEGIRPIDYILPLLQDWTYSHPNQPVVVSEHQGSVFPLYEGDKEYLPGLEAYMKSQHNLVSYFGQARTYIARP
ncbi:MAG TPA: hypothetical protein VKA87_08630, partial [Nitrososphaeraceae archaeon]|nr:hypothetical protein [Nitrososphaeraceae archaeon]